MSRSDEVYTISDEDVLDSVESLKQLTAKRTQTPRKTEKSERARARPHYMRAHSSPRALTASTLSLFCFGAGQLYNRQVKLGLLLLLTELLAVVSHWSAVMIWPSLHETAELFGVGPREMVVGAAGADLLLVVIVLLGIRQAYRRAEADAGEFCGLANPVLSGLASLLIPGWGQLFNAQLGKGLFFLFCLLVAVYTTAFAVFTPLLELQGLAAIPDSLRSPTTAGAAVLFVMGLLWTVSVYDAVLVAGYQRRLV